WKGPANCSADTGICVNEWPSRPVSLVPRAGRPARLSRLAGALEPGARRPAAAAARAGRRAARRPGALGADARLADRPVAHPGPRPRGNPGRTADVPRGVRAAARPGAGEWFL